ncbi:MULTISPECIES: hypothetical protein [Oscillatoriales]|nr:MULTISPECIES: hypothetical protein [Oscillatoriales]
MQPNDIEVSGVHNLLPLKSLPLLNSRLSHPIHASGSKNLA